jgi:catechol 2,3-dioxygenase-like lactoylglutathione lyase family enzyme
MAVAAIPYYRKPQLMPPFDVLEFSHIGFVVASIDEFRASWGAVLGADHWQCREATLAPGSVQLHGDLVTRPARTRVGYARIGGLPVELIEPGDGPSRAAEWLAAHGAGLHHLAMWVRDLPAELERLAGQAEVSYSPAALVPALASRPVAAAVTAAAERVSETVAVPRPPFWAYLEPLAGQPLYCTLELLDARFARDYREYYGDAPYYPGDLPGAFTR